MSNDGYIKDLEKKIEELERRNEIHEKYYSEMTWGTLGPDGKGDAEGNPKKVRMVDMSSEHLKNVLLTQDGISKNRMDTILEILKDRDYDEIPEEKDIARLNKIDPFKKYILEVLEKENFDIREIINEHSSGLKRDNDDDK